MPLTPEASHTRGRRATPSSPPDLGGDLDDEGQLRHLLVVAERVAVHRRRETALRREAELVERRVRARFLDPPERSSFVSSVPRFVVTRPSTTCFSPSGRNRSGSKPPER